MRIDFRAAFTKIDRLLEAPTTDGASPRVNEPFSNVLAKLLPSAAQLNGNTGVNVSPSDDSPHRSGVPNGGPMASFNFRPPELQHPPQINSISNDPQMEVNPPMPNVNNLTPQKLEPPHLLEVKRTSGSESLRAILSMPSQERMLAIREMVGGAGTKYGVDPALGMAVAAAESSFDPLAISSDGHASKGLFQLLDSTGSELHGLSGAETGYDPFNPKMNVELGVSYLRRLHEIFSRETAVLDSTSTVAAANSASLEKLAVAAFNAGEGRVTSAQARAVRAGKDASQYADVQAYLPESTQQYVTRVMALRDRFSAVG